MTYYLYPAQCFELWINFDGQQRFIPHINRREKCIYLGLFSKRDMCYHDIQETNSETTILFTKGKKNILKNIYFSLHSDKDHGRSYINVFIFE